MYETTYILNRSELESLMFRTLGTMCDVDANDCTAYNFAFNALLRALDERQKQKVDEYVASTEVNSDVE